MLLDDTVPAAGDALAGGASEAGSEFGNDAACETPGVVRDRGDGRDILGKFTGAGGYGKDVEAAGLHQYEELTGRSPISQQIRVTLPNGSQRYYEGLAEKPDGTFEGIEVKSGGASLSKGHGSSMQQSATAPRQSER
jgi:hypothetical protein